MAGSDIRLERLTVLEAGRVAAMRAEGRVEGYLFLDRLVDDWSTGANRFDAPGEVLLAATDRESLLVGLGGLNVDPYLDDPRTARLRHVYVRASHRRRGTGGRLVRRLVEHARAASFARIRLRTNDEGAARFYESLGFERAVGSGTATHELVLE